MTETDLTPENSTTLNVRAEWYIGLIGGGYGTSAISAGGDYSEASGIADPDRAMAGAMYTQY